MKRPIEDEGVDVASAAGSRAAGVVALAEALERRAELDASKGRLVELRFFGGLSIDETAQVLGVSPGTVMRIGRWQTPGSSAPWRSRRWTRNAGSASNSFFHRTLAMAPDRRAALLAAECGEDSELRAEVESLVASHERPSRLLDDEGVALAAEMLAGRQRLAFSTVADSAEAYGHMVKVVGKSWNPTELADTLEARRMFHTQEVNPR